jgi:hypothetical protein
VWARGLTPNENGKAITVNGQRHFLRNAEHYDGRTVLTVVTTVELEHDAEVIVHE